MDHHTGITSQIKTEPVTQKGQRSKAKRKSDRERAKTRVNIGNAFPRWRALKEERGLQLDADVALFLLDAYEETHAASTQPKTTSVASPAFSSLAASASGRYLQSESPPEWQSHKRSSSTETCESVHYEYLIMSSPNEAEWETSEVPSDQSSDDEQESSIKDAWSLKGLNLSTTEQKSKESTAMKEEAAEDVRSSLSMGDGRYVVDLGSSSEFIVDEECILQLFRSCRKCHGRCTVRKHVRGLQLAVYQTCSFCQSCRKWTNLSSDDHSKVGSEFQVNGKDEGRVDVVSCQT